MEHVEPLSKYCDTMQDMLNPAVDMGNLNEATHSDSPRDLVQSANGEFGLLTYCLLLMVLSSGRTWPWLTKGITQQEDSCHSQPSQYGIHGFWHSIQGRRFDT